MAHPVFDGICVFFVWFHEDLMHLLQSRVCGLSNRCYLYFLQSWVCFKCILQFPPNRSDAEQNLVVAEIGNKDLKFICLLFLPFNYLQLSSYKNTIWKITRHSRSRSFWRGKRTMLFRTPRNHLTKIVKANSRNFKKNWIFAIMGETEKELASSNISTCSLGFSDREEENDKMTKLH